MSKNRSRGIVPLKKGVAMASRESQYMFRAGFLMTPVRKYSAKKFFSSHSCTSVHRHTRECASVSGTCKEQFRHLVFFLFFSFFLPTGMQPGCCQRATPCPKRLKNYGVTISYPPTSHGCESHLQCEVSRAVPCESCVFVVPPENGTCFGLVFKPSCTHPM